MPAHNTTPAPAVETTGDQSELYRVAPPVAAPVTEPTVAQAPAETVAAPVAAPVEAPAAAPQGVPNSSGPSVGSASDLFGPNTGGSVTPSAQRTGNASDLYGAAGAPADTDPQAAGVTAAGAVSGAVDASSMMAGATTAFKAAVKLPIPHPVPKAIVVGGLTIAGGLYGIFAGHKAKGALANVKIGGQQIAYKSINDVPAQLRPAFVFGENMGAGVSLAGGTIVLAKTGAKVLNPGYVGKVLNGLMDQAKNSSKRFALDSTVSATGAGFAGAITEGVAPGNIGARIGAEVVGGTLMPSRVILASASWLGNSFASIKRTFSASSVETEAAKILQGAYLTTGDDIVASAAILRSTIENNPSLVAATVAQRVGDDTLIGLEKALMSKSAQLGADVEKSAAATMSAFKDTIAILRGSGDPELILHAAKVEARYFTTLLSGRLDDALEEAADAATALLGKGSGSRTEIAINAYNAADSALKQSRVIETGYWDLVPKEMIANHSSIKVAYAALKETMLKSVGMPKVLQTELKAFEEAGISSVTGGSTSVGYLKIFRSNMLRMAREAGSNPERSSEAVLYGRMAEAALDDIDQVFKAKGVTPAARQAYDTARDFSKSLHAVFTNTFTGKNLAEGAQGLRLAPEALMKRAFAGGAEVTNLRLNELAEATRFLPKLKAGGPDADRNVQLMLEAQESYFAIMAAEVAGVAVGPARSDAILKFVAKNPELAERFPEVTKILKAAGTSQRAADSIAALNKEGGRVLSERTAFGKLVGSTSYENPLDAIVSVLGGKSPRRSFTNMAKLAAKNRDKTPGVIEGFQATVIDAAVREASDAAGVIDFTKLHAFLKGPIGLGTDSVLDIMVKTGTADAAFVKGFDTVLDAADKVVKTLASSGAVIDPAGGGASMLMLAAAKMVGSRAATTAAAGGNSIIVANIGAKFGERLMASIPAGKVQALLVRAAQDPELMLLLMEKPVKGVVKLKTIEKIHAKLVALGILPVMPLAIGGTNAAATATE